MVKRIDRSLERLEKLEKLQESPEIQKPIVFQASPVVTKNNPVESTAPANYKEKMLSTKGKLSVPAKIHVRDYMGIDAMELSMSNGEDFLEQLLRIVKKMVWEDIDPYMLHQKELEEIMVFVYGTNWDTALQGYEYIPTDEEWEGMTDDLKKRYTDGETDFTCNIDIAKIQSIPIPNDFEEPMEYEKDGIVYQFRLPRIGDSILAKKYTDEKFKNDREDLMPIILADKRGEDLEEYVKDKNGNSIPKFPTKELSRYTEFVDKYLDTIKKATQGQFIVSVDGKSPEGIENQIAFIDEIPAKVWIEYTKDLTELNFGMDPEVEVMSPVSRKPVARRFRFQFMDFLPSV